MDPITTMNLALSLVIVAVATVTYGKRKNPAALYIGAAFGLFGLTHLLNLLNLAGLTTALIVRNIVHSSIFIARTLAYLVVIFALLRIWKS